MTSTKATSERIIETWLSGLTGPDDRGFLERRPALIIRTRRLVKRILNSPWSTPNELTRKDRWGNDEVDATIDNLRDLTDAGVIRLAWDHDGYPRYAAADAELPTWLSTSDTDDDLEALPLRN